MSFTLPTVVFGWAWNLGTPTELSRRCIHKAFTWNGTHGGFPWLGPSSLCLWSWILVAFDLQKLRTESPMSLDILCFWTQPESSKVSKKPCAGFSSLSFPTGHYHLPGKIPFSADTLSKSMFGQLWEEPEVGMAAEDGPLWNEEVALSTLNPSLNLVWISSWTQRDLIPSHLHAPTLQVLIHIQFLSASSKKCWSSGSVCIVPCPSGFSSIDLLAHNLTLTGSEIPWCGSQPAGMGWCRCV